MLSLALCLSGCVVGVKNTVMRAPLEPTGGKTPEAGLTVISLLLPDTNTAKLQMSA